MSDTDASSSSEKGDSRGSSGSFLDHDPSSPRNAQPVGEKSENPEQTADVPPDGGFRAWLVVFGAVCASLCSFGWVNSVGIFQSYYQRVALKEYSPSTVAWIISLELFFVYALGPLVGRAYDAYGSTYLMILGTFMHVFGLMMTSLASEYYQFLLAQGVCSAIGLALVFQPSLNAVSTYFDKKRAIAFGLTIGGSSIGGIIFPIMLERLITEIGFAWAMRTCAFFILFLLTIATILVRPRTKPRPTPMTLADFTEPFKNMEFLWTALGSFLFIFGFFIPISFVIVEATAHGMSSHLANYLLPMLNAASFFGRVFAGIAADKFGRFNVYIICSYISAIIVLALWIPAQSNAALIVFAVLFGFFSGAFISLLFALVAQISPQRRVGTNTGLILMINSIGALVTSPIAGAIVQQEHGSYLGLKIFAGVMCFAGTTLTIFARASKVGFNPLKKY